MRRLVQFTAIALALSVGSRSASAVDATVPFTGLVLSTCVLTVGTPGLLGTSTDYQTLSSQASGGLAGSVTALSTGTGFRVSAIAPSSFTLSPPGYSGTPTFSANYSGVGSTSIGPTPGTTATTLNTGLTTLSVNLTAQDSAGPFAGGAYAAEVIVRCE